MNLKIFLRRYILNQSTNYVLAQMSAKSSKKCEEIETKNRRGKRIGEFNDFDIIFHSCNVHDVFVIYKYFSAIVQRARRTIFISSYGQKCCLLKYLYGKFE